MDDSELLTGFENASLPDGAFRHRDHVRVAWLFVTRFGLPAAIPRFVEGLQRFAAAKGAPQLYHATITWAYLLVIAERAAASRALTWDEFAAANSDLLSWNPSLLDRYYTRDLLWSDRARAGFVMPDRLATSAAEVTEES
jgi:hypothetical protein